MAVFEALREAARVCVCVYLCVRAWMCVHAQQDPWPKAVPGSSASAFFFFLEKGRLKITVAFFPVFLLCSFLASGLCQITQCVRNLAVTCASPDMWDCISVLSWHCSLKNDWCVFFKISTWCGFHVCQFQRSMCTICSLRHTKRERGVIKSQCHRVKVSQVSELEAWCSSRAEAFYEPTLCLTPLCTLWKQHVILALTNNMTPFKPSAWLLLHGLFLSLSALCLFWQESMDRTSSHRPEELIVPGFQRPANQNLPHHHGNFPFLSLSNLCQMFFWVLMWKYDVLVIVVLYLCFMLYVGKDRWHSSNEIHWLGKVIVTNRAFYAIVPICKIWLW